MRLRYAVTVVLAGLGLLLGAPAASAQDRPIKLEVVGDGGHNVNVLVTWKEGGTPVTEIVEATLVATAADGRSFGPVPLRSSPEGQNLYHSAQPLPSGEWEVTVTTTKPANARKTTKVTAQDIAAVPVAATAPARDAAAAPASDGDLPLKIGVIVLAAVLALAVWIGLARRQRADIRR
ncbi:hypothetical protein [Acrocarpospora macrocephala]|uniref:YtkA-like domain-containing protein n=1 Tax=Acrocarpospora macrocephala TaxID=150177 RepID=A0A5M3WVI2_9ACTN|nr:hypothetical protein [Acrocarpospora macrocephala]GES11999.1 hypothetical protein Amac_055960 [Acrocarpospora macrocephala]